MPERYANKFSLRIDVDTSHGMSDGLPKMLDIFNKFGIVANIYVVMGPDKNFQAMKRHFGLLKAINSLRSGLPRIVARSNPEIIARLLKEKHFLSPHGWDHQRYSLISLSKSEKRKEFDQAVSEFTDLFKFKPMSYLFPCDLIDDDGSSFVEEAGMRYLSYNSHSFNELTPYWKNGIFYLPIFPFYDGDMLYRRDTEDKILKTYTSYVDLCIKSGSTCSIAMHPCQIGSKDSYLNIVENLLAHIRERGLESMRIDQLSEL